MKVRIKTWEEMEKEFGVDNVGDIKCKETFSTYMEELLPKDRIIEIEENGKNNMFKLYNVYDWCIYNVYAWGKYDINEWNITDDMIEEIIEE